MGSICVPVHVGVIGNEVKDKVAKQENIDVKIHLGWSEWRFTIKQEIRRRWPQMKMKRKVGIYIRYRTKGTGKGFWIGENRWQQVIMTRLRLGHCVLAWNLTCIGKHYVHCVERRRLCSMY